jgi:hypothetical protein
MFKMTPMDWHDWYMVQYHEAFVKKDWKLAENWLKISKIKLASSKVTNMTIAQMNWYNKSLNEVDKNLYWISTYKTYDKVFKL